MIQCAVLRETAKASRLSPQQAAKTCSTAAARSQGCLSVDGFEIEFPTCILLQGLLHCTPRLGLPSSHAFQGLLAWRDRASPKTLAQTSHRHSFYTSKLPWPPREFRPLLDYSTPFSTAPTSSRPPAPRNSTWRLFCPHERLRSVYLYTVSTLDIGCSTPRVPQHHASTQLSRGGHHPALTQPRPT